MQSALREWIRANAPVCLTPPLSHGSALDWKDHGAFDEECRDYARNVLVGRVVVRGSLECAIASIYGVLQSVAAKEPLKQPTADEHVRNRFEQLARRWREETKTFSSTTDRVLHSAYQDIIGMGMIVVPLILHEMETNGGHWFWALRHITGENPVLPQDAGKIQKMTDAWLRWGRERYR